MDVISIGPRNRARLLICEDVEDLITQRRDGSLERLLNVTDGILGQDRDLMVLISTNADASRLHPAIKRAGRCLARVGFDRFTVPEARALLNGTGAAVTSRLTLTELLELKGVIRQIRTDEPPPLTGTYL
jgi:hypothetical protein